MELVFSSSATVYGWPKFVPCTEEYSICALNPYGRTKVFDGHGEKHATDFVHSHSPRFIVKDEGFPQDIERAITSAFLQIDNAFAEAYSLDANLGSSTYCFGSFCNGKDGACYIYKLLGIQIFEYPCFIRKTVYFIFVLQS